MVSGGAEPILRRTAHVYRASAAPPDLYHSVRMNRTVRDIVNVARRLPVGAEALADGSVHFCVWAPRRRTVDAILDPVGAGDDAHRGAPRVVRLEPEPGGYFAGLAEAVAPGTRYRYRLDAGPEFPDPASRWQPEGPAGPSAVIDPASFEWTDHDWPGVGRDGHVIYEMHIGTFTRDGDWAAAANQLPALADLGITLLEVMPIADFPGRFGWGYDGVNLFAPTRLYGHPDDMRRFVDRAHALGLGVILDVVYNHFGPAQNHLQEFAREYVSDRHRTDWGPAVNFDGDGAGPVREFFLANAGYWIDEFHLDGIRLDATQNICDDSDPHIVAELVPHVREAAGRRGTYIVAENEPQDARFVRSAAAGGYAVDALWNDDFHHSAIVALTGRAEAYYSDHRGRAQEFVAAARFGFLYQGQWYRRQKQRRGTPARDLAPRHFVHFIQNHDQVANSLRGERVHQLTSPGRLRAMTALLLLGPQTPLLFQGQEFAASAPFLYFADQDPALRASVRDGRATFLAQFPSMAEATTRDLLPDPGDPESFARCKLDHGERIGHAGVYALHRDLLALRSGDATFARQDRGIVDGAVLSADAFVIRWTVSEDDKHRALLVNLGGPLALDPIPEPLIAPPNGMRWTVRLSTEDSGYGGLGNPALEAPDSTWSMPGECAYVLFPTRGSPDD
jgi:maltooligosyltrehalose trehalohydrolase